MAFQSYDTMLQQVDMILRMFTEKAKAGGSTEDAHLKLDDVKGSDSADGFKDQIPVLFYQDFVVTTGGQTGTGSGKATASDVFLVVPTDKSYPILKQSSATGSPFKEAQVTHRRAEKGEQKPYEQDKFKDIRISLVLRTQTSVTQYPDICVIALQHAEAEWNHAIANVKAGYNYATAKKV